MSDTGQTTGQLNQASTTWKTLTGRVKAIVCGTSLRVKKENIAKAQSQKVQKPTLRWKNVREHPQILCHCY